MPLAFDDVALRICKARCYRVRRLLGGGEPETWAAAPPLLIPFAAADTSAEAVPAGSYSQDFQAALAALGVKLREEPAARTAALRGTSAFAVRATAGWRTAEVRTSVTFAEAR